MTLKNMHVRLHNIIGACYVPWCLLSHTPHIGNGGVQGSSVHIEDQLYSPHVKRLDFGLARMIMHDAQQLGGALRWMAPEVIRNLDGKPNTSEDIFSLGHVMHYVTT